MSKPLPLPSGALPYCPGCGRLIGRDLRESGQAVQRDGHFFHRECLSAEAVVDDLPRVVEVPKITTQAITVGRVSSPGGGSRISARRKTGSHALRTAGADAPDRRRAQSRRSPLIAGMLAAVVILGVGGILWYLNAQSGPDTVRVETAPLHPTSVQPTAAPTPSKIIVSPAAGPVTITPPTPEPPAVQPQLSPYELSKLQPVPPATQPVSVPPSPVTGPAKPLFDGKSLDGWEVVKGSRDDIKVQNGELVVTDGHKGVYLRTPLPAGDYDITLEVQYGTGENGGMMEIGIGMQIFDLTAGQFQGPGWKPIGFQMRGGVLTVQNGKRGSLTLANGKITPKSVYGDFHQYADNRHLLIGFSMGEIAKHVRNIQLTPH